MLCFPKNLKDSVPGVPDANPVQLFKSSLGQAFQHLGEMLRHLQYMNIHIHIHIYIHIYIYVYIYICTYMLGIHDFPKVLIQSGGSHLQHANPVQLFIHTHARPAPNHKELLRDPIGILLES